MRLPAPHPLEPPLYIRPALANWSYYAATSAFSTNSLRRRCFCKLTAHCNKPHDTVDILGPRLWILPRKFLYFLYQNDEFYAFPEIFIDTVTALTTCFEHIIFLKGTLIKGRVSGHPGGHPTGFATGYPANKQTNTDQSGTAASCDGAELVILGVTCGGCSGDDAKEAVRCLQREVSSVPWRSCQQRLSFNVKQRTRPHC